MCRRFDPALSHHMPRWSSGQDVGLSIRRREFDSRTGRHTMKYDDLYAPLAQLVEQAPFKREVGGPYPPRRTICISVR